jgi:hypothetical protein
VTSLSALTRGVLAGADADAHKTRGRPLPLHPSEFRIIVCECARTGKTTDSIQNYNKRVNGKRECLLVVTARFSELQPVLALHFLTTKCHLRTVTIPIDSGNFDVVSARDHSRALRST